jgi:hypothetical protein
MSRCIAEVVFSSAKNLPPPDVNVGNISADDPYMHPPLSPVTGDLPYQLPQSVGGEDQPLTSIVGLERRRSSTFSDLNQFPAPPQRVSDEVPRGRGSTDFAPPADHQDAGRSSTYPRRSSSPVRTYIPPIDIPPMTSTFAQNPSGMRGDPAPPMPMPFPHHPAGRGSGRPAPYLQNEGYHPEPFQYRGPRDMTREHQDGPPRHLPTRHPGGADEGEGLLWVHASHR